MILTSLLHPTSKVMGRQVWGCTPAQAVYSASFPTGIPIPVIVQQIIKCTTVFYFQNIYIYITNLM